MTFACLYIPDFSVQAVVRLEPDLRGRAVAVVEPEPPPARVFALNPAARAAGVEGGMSQVETALYPGVEVRRRSPAAEASAHATLLNLAQSFSPRFEDAAADTVALDLTGLRALLGPARKAARDLEARARELGLEANAALAPNPDAARLAARGFAGVTLIGAGEEAERLGGLPVEVLAPSPEMQETLARWGIRTFRALAALPPEELSERLGQEGIRLRRLACGGELRALVPAEEPLHFEEALDLEYSVAEIEPLAFILGRLLNQLCARLTARGRATQEMRMVLGVEQGREDRQLGEIENPKSKIQNRKLPSHESRILRLPVPMRDPRLLLKLWLLDLEAHPPSAPVCKLAITAEPTQPRVAQSDLFLPCAPDPQKLELTLARLRGTVGEGRSGSPELLDTHRPDAFRVNRFAAECRDDGLRNEKSRRRKAKSEIRNLRFESPESRITSPEPRAPNPEPRPCVTLRLFRPPLAARVDVQDGQPFRVEARGIAGRVTSAAGPWRTSGEWWTGNPWGRDEWDVEIRSVVRGPLSVARVESQKSRVELVRLYRIYYNLTDGQWFFEGQYD
jgi:protein ImuB